MNRECVVLMSGGIDSCVLAFYLNSLGFHITGVSVNYGQRHKIELGYASAIAIQLGIAHEVLDFRELVNVFGGSCLVDVDSMVPHGHYESNQMKATVVPNRNMVLLSIGSALAVSRKINYVAYAAHAGDYAIYPDCRQTFAAAMKAAIRECDVAGPELLFPFIEFKKPKIISIGHDLSVPWHKTWSCYEGGEIHCGRCAACNERQESFRLSGVCDPTEYSLQ